MSTKTGRAPIAGCATPPTTTAAPRPARAASPSRPPSLAVLATSGGKDRAPGRGAPTRLVARVQPRRTGDVELREAVTGRRVAAVRAAVALRAALAAWRAGQAAEPLTGGAAALRAATALEAGLAGERRVQVVAADCRRPAWVARAAAAPDTASRYGSQGDVRPRQEEAGTKRARGEELEELTARRAPCERLSGFAREIHQSSLASTTAAVPFPSISTKGLGCRVPSCSSSDSSWRQSFARPRMTTLRSWSSR